MSTKTWHIYINCYRIVGMLWCVYRCVCVWINLIIWFLYLSNLNNIQTHTHTQFGFNLPLSLYCHWREIRVNVQLCRICVWFWISIQFEIRDHITENWQTGIVIYCHQLTRGSFGFDSIVINLYETIML